MNYDLSFVVIITVICYSLVPSSGDYLFTCGAIFPPPRRLEEEDILISIVGHSLDELTTILVGIYAPHTSAYFLRIDVYNPEWHQSQTNVLNFHTIYYPLMGVCNSAQKFFHNAFITFDLQNNKGWIRRFPFAPRTVSSEDQSQNCVSCEHLRAIDANCSFDSRFVHRINFAPFPKKLPVYF